MKSGILQRRPKPRPRQRRLNHHCRQSIKQERALYAEQADRRAGQQGSKGNASAHREHVEAYRLPSRHKELRAKVRAVPADHDPASSEAALRFCSESEEHLTTGVLFDVERPTLVGEMMSIRWRAQGDAPPPTRSEMLQTFAAS